MLLYHLCVPSLCLKHFFAGRAPVAINCQALLPDILAFDTELASRRFLKVCFERSSFGHCVRSLLSSDPARVTDRLLCRDLSCEHPYQSLQVRWVFEGELQPLHSLEAHLCSSHEMGSGCACVRARVRTCTLGHGRARTEAIPNRHHYDTTTTIAVMRSVCSCFSSMQGDGSKSGVGELSSNRPKSCAGELLSNRAARLRPAAVILHTFLSMTSCPCTSDR